MSFHRSKKLKTEIGSWLSEGIISEQQAELLNERYELGADAPWYKNTGFIIKGVAFLLLAMSLFLIISSNWDELHIALRVAVGLVPLLATYAAGAYYWQQHDKLKSELFMFLASLMFGANIALLAQIFHISSYFPNGLLWWILGSLPVIVVYRSFALSLAVQLIFVIWLGMQSQYEQFSFWAIPIEAVFIWMLYTKSTRLGIVVHFVVGFLLLFNVLTVLEDVWGYGFSITHYYMLIMAYAFLYFSGYLWLQDGFTEKFTLQLRIAVGLLSFLFLYSYTFYDFFGSGADVNEQFKHFFSPFILLIGALVLYFANPKNQPPTQKEDLLFLLVGSVPFLVYAFIGRFPGREYAMGWTVFTNLVFFGGSIAIMLIGINDQRKVYFVLGVIGVVILAITRYLNYFESYWLTALVFTACAFLLMGINKLWNKNFSS